MSSTTLPNTLTANAAAVVFIIMQDSTTPAAIQSPQAFAAYDDGLYSDFAVIKARFPDALCLRITVFAADGEGQVLDIENSDATPAEAPAWVRAAIARGIKKPILYANAATMPAVIAEMSHAGFALDDYMRWVADYNLQPNFNGLENLNPSAHQYTEQGFGRNLDLSVCLPELFGNADLPGNNSPRYNLFATGPFLVHKLHLDERSVVERYDRLQAQAKLTKAQQATLKVTELHLRWLAQRIYSVAHHQLKNGKASWNVDHRGWRFRQLRLRGAGAKPASQS